VLLECGNAAARRAYRDSVIDLRRQLQRKGLLIKPSEADCDAAWTAFERRQTPTAGIVDHISFEVMRRLGIQEAFTNDQHFAAEGFQVLF
jgi:predicted nucleic acid-binding protein